MMKHLPVFLLLIIEVDRKIRFELFFCLCKKVKDRISDLLRFLDIEETMISAYADNFAVADALQTPRNERICLTVRVRRHLDEPVSFFSILLRK